MRNLAGDKDCDRHIRDELERARIEIVEGERSTHEVGARLTGKLCGWTFRRAWYYWVAEGQLPLEAAQLLYADPVGKADIRVNGHCGCPPPEPPWVHYYDVDGNRLYSDPDGKEARQAIDFVHRGILKQEQFNCSRLVPDAAAVATRAVIESYHIDSEVGLRLFADTLRALPKEATGG